MHQHPWLLHLFFYQHLCLSSTQSLTALIHILSDHKSFLKHSTEGKLHQAAHWCPRGGNCISDFQHLACNMPYPAHNEFFPFSGPSFNLNKYLWSYVHPVFLSSVPSCRGTDSLVLQNPLESQTKAALALFIRAGIQDWLKFSLPLIFPQSSILTSKHYYRYDWVKLKLTWCCRKLD